MASSSGIAVLISFVRLTSSFPLSSMGKVPTFFGCSKSCFADRQRSLHACAGPAHPGRCTWSCRSEEHTSELQSRLHLVCRLLLEKKKKLRSSLSRNRLSYRQSR